MGDRVGLHVATPAAAASAAAAAAPNTRRRHVSPIDAIPVPDAAAAEGGLKQVPEVDDSSISDFGSSGSSAGGTNTSNGSSADDDSASLFHTVKKRQWLEGFEQFRAFVQIHGMKENDKDYPIEFQQNVRAYRKLLKDNVKEDGTVIGSDYTKARVKKLQGIGLAANVRPTHEQSFNDRFARLQSYKQEHGHCKVPQGYAGRNNLGMWLSNIRSKLNTKLKNNSLSNRDRAQIAMLEQLGVVFKSRAMVGAGNTAADTEAAPGASGDVGAGGTTAATAATANTGDAPTKLPPLPPGWTEFQDASGTSYYYHEETNETTWERPSALHEQRDGVPPPPPPPPPPESESGAAAGAAGGGGDGGLKALLVTAVAEQAKISSRQQDWLEKQQEQINDHDDRITGTEADVAGLKSDQHRLDVRVGSLESDRAKSKKDMDKAKKDIDELKNRVAALTPCKMPPDEVAAASTNAATVSGPAGPNLGASYQALGLVTPAKPAPAPAPAAAAAAAVTATATATAAIGADVGVPSIPSKISKNELESRDDVPVTPAKAAPTGRAVVPSASTTAKKKNKKSSAMVAAATTTFVKLSTSDRKIIRRYTSAHEICEKARNGREFKTFFHKEKDVKELDDIGNVLDKLPAVPEKTILYRATDSTAEQADVWRHAALAKMVYIDPAPVSASKLTFPKQEEKMVNEFIERNTRWTIQSTTGKFIKKYSKKSHEEEVTFRPGSKFRVLSFQDMCPDKPHDWKGKYLIRVEEF